MNNLHTRLLNTIDNKSYTPLIFNWKTTYCKNCIYFELYVKNDSDFEKIGDCSFEIQENSIYIEFMENTSINKKYKYVGTAIHEIVFRQSIIENLNGKVTLDSLPSATIFHFNSGFRVIPEACRETLFERTGNNKEIIFALIRLVAKYDYELKYKIRISSKEVSSIICSIFNIIYENLFLLTSVFQIGLLVKILQENKIQNIIEKMFPYNDLNQMIKSNINRLNDDYLYPMFLPEMTIEEKKQKFSLSYETIDKDCPIQVMSILNNSEKILNLKNKVITYAYNKYLNSIESYFREYITKEFESGVHRIINHFGRKSPVEQIKRSRNLPF